VPEVIFPKRKEKKRKGKEKKYVYRNLRMLYHGSYSESRTTLLKYKKAEEKQIGTAFNGFKQV
jgi:hypothetical protein